MSNEKSALATAVKDETAESGKSDGAPADNPPAPSSDQGLAEQIAKYGITRVPVDYFHLGEYRYTRLEDAVAQAKRSTQIPPPLGA